MTILERINDNMEKRQVRRLKNLRISEISMVDRGAGEGVNIVLAKRHDEPEESNMQTQSVDVTKALPMWESYVDLVAKRDKCSRSIAYDKAMREMPDIYTAAKRISGAGTILKLGSDGIDQSPSFSTPSESFDGGRVVSRTRNAPHGGSHPQPFNPYDSISGTETGESALARYRSQYKARIRDGMDGLTARAKTFADIGGKGLSAADVLNEEAKANDELVAEQRSKERDANQLRRPARGTSQSNGSGQRGLGVTSNPSRSM
jgi:hypothetical protein